MFVTKWADLVKRRSASINLIALDNTVKSISHETDI